MGIFEAVSGNITIENSGQIFAVSFLLNDPGKMGNCIVFRFKEPIVKFPVSAFRSRIRIFCVCLHRCADIRFDLAAAPVMPFPAMPVGNVDPDNTFGIIGFLDMTDQHPERIPHVPFPEFRSKGFMVSPLRQRFSGFLMTVNIR